MVVHSYNYIIIKTYLPEGGSINAAGSYSHR